MGVRCWRRLDSRRLSAVLYRGIKLLLRSNGKNWVRGTSKEVDRDSSLDSADARSILLEAVGKPDFPF